MSTPNAAANLESIYPLSPLQTGMLYHSLEAPEAGMYFMQGTYPIPGEVDVAAFRAAWQMLVDRHAMFRTRVLWEKREEPLQVVSRQLPVPFEHRDCQAVPPSERAAHLRGILAADRARGFDLAQPPLMRVLLVQYAPADFFFVWSYHHILLDGWSVSVVMREFSQLYTSLSRREPVELPPALPFKNYVQWLKAQPLGEAERYWRGMLDGYANPTPLPGKRSSTANAVETVGDFDSRRYWVPADVSASLQALARQHRVTVNVLYQSAWALLLSRHCGLDDVTFGITTSGRDAPIDGIENMVGMFLNSLPLRLRLDREETVLSWWQRVQATLVASRHYEFTPLDQVRKWSSLPPGQPLFESLFVYENYPKSLGPGSGLRPKDAPKPEEEFDSLERTNFPLTLVVGDGQPAFVRIDFDTQRFDADLVAALYAQLEQILREYARPDAFKRAVHEIEVRPPAEIAACETELNATAGPFSRDALIPDLFFAQAERTPDAVAVICGDERRTYAELRRDVVALSYELREAHGIGPNEIVGVWLGQSVAMISATLGIMASGGAYLPIDRTMPAQRIKYMLRNSRARCLLVDRAVPPEFEFSGTVIDLRALAGRGGDRAPLRGVARPTDLAYVIYTSGSTGEPKAAMMEHRGVVNTLEDVNERYGIGPADRVFSISSICFDLSVYDYFGTLAIGAAVVLPRDEERKDPERWCELIERHGITVWNSVPALVGLLTRHVEERRQPVAAAVRLFMMSGDWIPVSLPAAIRAAFPAARLISMGGATEGSIWSIFHPIGDVDPRWPSIPYGRPMKNQTYHILDRHLAPVPLFAEGDLYIGGVGVARGYLFDDEKTARSFLRDPRTGERIYRTGDVGRFLPGGVIEFLGRKDFQVKVRGYRIELGEIESALLGIEGVKAAVATVRGEKDARVLCAYFTGDPTIDLAAMKSRLGVALPEYMVPQHLLRLEALPLTANGKVDRKLLPDPVAAAPVAGFQEPATPAEKLLAQAWAEVLKLPRVGATDNYFVLGGDSIKSILIASKVARAGFKLNVADVFKHPTVRELAPRLRAAAAAPATMKEKTGVIAATPFQRWFLERGFSARDHWNQSQAWFRPGALDATLTRAAFNAVIAHHDALRLRLDDSRRELVIVPAAEAPAVAVTDLRGRAEEDFLTAAEAAANDLQAGLSLTAGPLLRAGIMRSDAGDHLVVVVHHLAVDAVSWRILEEDFFSAYAQVVAQRQPVLAARTVPFGVWTERLRQHADGKGRRELPYWRGRIAEGASARGALARYSLGRVRDEQVMHFAVEPDVTQSLLQDANRAYRTETKDLLLAGLTLALADWQQQNAFWVTLEGHGREALFDGVETHRTVGWFTSHYPVLLRSGGEALADQIRGTKEMLRAIPHHGIGYGLLRYLAGLGAEERAELAVEPSLSFNYLGESAGSAPTRKPLRLGRNFGPENQRLTPIELDAIAIGGRLVFSLRYDGAAHAREEFTRFVDALRARLAEIGRHCTAVATRLSSPSDFDLRGLSLRGFDQLMRQAEANGLALDAVAAIHPASPLQEGIYLHHLAQPRNEAYAIQIAYTLEGSIDTVALRRAYADLVRNHEVLRSRYLPSEAGPMLFILKDAAAPFTEADVRMLPPEEIDRLMAEDRAAGFDLAAGHPSRLRLFRTGEHSWRLLFTVHHIALDGWCIGLVTRELLSLYEQHRGAPPAALPERAAYSRYLEWLRDQDRDEALRYWKTYLEGIETVPALPRLSGAHAGGYREQRALHTFDAALCADLDRECRRQGLTLNSALQLAWAVVLRSYAETPDVVFGSVVSGRGAPIPGIENSIGLFINTLPVRVRLQEDRAFFTQARELQEAFRTCESHGYVPLSAIEEAAGLGGRGLVNHVLVFENYAGGTVVGGGAGGGPERKTDFRVADANTAERTNFDFNLVIVPGPQLKVLVSFNAGAIDADLACGIGPRLEWVLRHVVAQPHRVLGEIPLVSSEEQQRVALTLDATARGYAGADSVIDRFAEVAGARADAVAIVDGERRVTYRELAQRVRSIARHLHATEKVGPGAVVGLVAERTWHVVAAMLGILESGAAFLPLDPESPAARLESVRREMGVEVVLAPESLARRSGLGSRVVAIESVPVGPESVPALPPLSASDAAYVICTSGSTGRPKGVVVEHGALRNQLHAVIGAYGHRAAQRHALALPLTFDPSIQVVLSPLLTGGELHLYSAAQVRDPAALRPDLATRRVDVIAAPPSFWELLLTACPDPGALDLDTVISGGESLHPNLHRRLRERFRARLVVNAYGPTETCINATWCLRVPDETEERIPIGGAVDGYVLSIRDPRGAMLPPLARGEIWIGGAGLARGYLNDPELTAARFAVDARTGERMYRTGDTGQVNARGEIDFLGRVDDQVKVRGHRIELGEIVAALKTHPSIRDAAAVVQTLRSGNREICAYYVSGTAGAPTAAELRTYLRVRLPVYMTPRFLLPLEAIQRSDNGKVARGALPAPELAASPGPVTLTADPVLRGVMEEWQAVLEIATLSPHDNFFDLGGSSMALVKVCERLKARFGLELRVVDLFAHTTAAALAEHIKEATAQRPPAAAPAAGPRPERRNRISSLQRQRREQERIGAR